MQLCGLDWRSLSLIDWLSHSLHQPVTHLQQQLHASRVLPPTALCLLSKVDCPVQMRWHWLIVIAGPLFRGSWHASHADVTIHTVARTQLTHKESAAAFAGTKVSESRACGMAPPWLSGTCCCFQKPQHICLRQVAVYMEQVSSVPACCTRMTAGLASCYAMGQQ